MEFPFSETLIILRVTERSCGKTSRRYMINLKRSWITVAEQEEAIMLMRLIPKPYCTNVRKSCILKQNQFAKNDQNISSEPSQLRFCFCNGVFHHICRRTGRSGKVIYDSLNGALFIFGKTIRGIPRHIGL